jgi:hypothetical protein
MKIKIMFFLFLFFFVTFLSAQNEQTTSHILNWKGIEKWYLDSTSVKVISFDGAQYPGENKFPYFNQRIVSDPAYSYNAVLKNVVYIQVTNDEKNLLSGSSFSSEPQIVKNTLHSRGLSYFNVSILPFVIREGNILKLQSFDLQIIKTSLPQEAKAAATHTYAQNSVLAQGKFVKIKIVDTGIYKLTYEDLVSMGVNPANVRVFGYGGNVQDQSFTVLKPDDLPELAIYMNKGTDGVFNAGDYILFYAQGINKWTYDNSKSMFTHQINSYSNYGYYFVTSDAGIGKKIDDEIISLPTSPTINQVEEFIDYQVHELESKNLSQAGKNFYGESFNDVNSYSLLFNFPNPVLTNSTTVRLDVASTSSTSSSFTLSLNGSQNKVLNMPALVQDNYTQGVGASGIFSYTPSTDQFNFNISFTRSAQTDVGYLNYLEVNARRQLKMSGSVMQFQSTDFLGLGQYNQYLISGANSNVQIWDITNPQIISRIATQTINGKTSFIDASNNLKSYLAIDPTVPASFQKPEIVGAISNQDLHGISQADMVIITHPDFLSQAQLLAQAHRDKDNLTVEVVTTDQVYNEFSSGTPDATAYRWMMKMLYDRAMATKQLSDLPKYLLLFGRGSYDNRKIDPNSDNFILTYQADNSLVTTDAYVTDDYFTQLEDNAGSDVSTNLMDVGVGRFPVTTAQQATDVVNKTIGYINNKEKGSWKNQLCFLADDGDVASHMFQADSIARSVGRTFPANQINKLYIDAYPQEKTASGQTCVAVKNRLQNLIQSGLFLLNYTGHAGLTGLASESVFTIAEIKALTNQHLSLFVGATCDFLQFDSQVVSGGGQMLLNPTGGSIGVFSAARPVYSIYNFNLNYLLCTNLFKKINGKQQRMGDVISFAKNNLGTETNKLSYIFMGDPALMLSYPTKYNIITSKVNQSTALGNDTLKALSVATIQGFIADENDNKISNFNGTLHAVVYDKIQQVTTLNDEGGGALTYSDRPNTLFSGNVDVKDGVFTFTFMLPKDIKYNFGSGRINYYAEDDTNNFEAQGSFENFSIGGANNNYNLNDTIGPSVKLYLNSENFVSGDKVNETPLLIANISDIDGINTVGSGIGHDLMLTLDNDPNQSVVLNDYFQASTNSYTSGVVKYKLSTLSNGNHTINFKAWDLLNNSTNVSINFEVVTGLSPVIFSIYNFPNPVKTQTSIVVNNDRPETILITTVEIFDLSGRKIWSFSQTNADNITWDLISNDGLRVKTGVYLYRVSIKTKGSDVTSKTNKMLIVEQ